MLKSIAIRPVVTASTRMTVTEAARAMRSKNVGALVVVNAGRPVGVLTDRDIVMTVVAQGKDPDVARVGDVMRRRPAVLQGDVGLLDAAQAFARTGVRRLPVVDRRGELTGIIAIDDLMILLGNGACGGRAGRRAAAPRSPICRGRVTAGGGARGSIDDPKTGREVSCGLGDHRTELRDL